MDSREQYQPEVTIVIMRECIRIKFVKKEADALNIYKRSTKNAEWLFTATVTNSPFDDFDVDLEEEMEYRFCGVKEKTEIGIPVTLSVDDLRHLNPT